MKNAYLTALCLTLMGASKLVALPTVSLSKVAGDSSGALGGGAFYAATQFEGTFTTFCLESGVGMSIGTTYYYDWSNVVQNQNDAISLGSALLIHTHAQGLFGANYAAWGGATGLQQAFWYLENEAGGVNNAFVTYASGVLGAALLSDANGAYGARVLNLWTNSNGTGDRQSQIAYFGVPDTGSTLVLLSLALGTVVCVSRRRQR
ncbi:MAG: VPDSG-CTERM sorting domain-containing protein [Opitutaceae bacterium]|nr:VPDSG-CTERM sorting domain-containing protein [Opitutaceae bacterium]